MQGCYIGVQPNGTVAARNYTALSIASSNSIIGGTTPAERNVIVNSSFNNIAIVGAGSNNRIQGNYIGTNAAITAVFSSSFGISIFSSGSGNKIDGIEAGAGNLISGDSNFGISAGSTGTIIQGNLIGTDVTGTNPLPNQGIGISVAAADILIGGTSAAARNIISGTNGGAINIGGDTTSTLSDNIIQGNYIGTDFNGIVPLSNQGGQAISIRGLSTVIGGTVDGAGDERQPAYINYLDSAI